MARTLLALMVAVLVALGAWFLLQETEPVDALEGPLATETEESEPKRAPADLVEAAPEATRTPEAAPAESTNGQSAASAEDAPVLVRVHGSVTLRDPDGTEYEEESGKVFLELERGELVECPLEAGRYEGRIEEGASFRAHHVELNSTACGFCEARGDFYFIAEEGFQANLQVCRRVPSVLAVRDRETRRDLAGVELWNREGWEFSDTPHPLQSTDATLAIANQVSPVTLPERDAEQAWWARAEGYAWERVDIDHATGGEHVLLLSREARLRVRLDNRPGDVDFSIRLRRSDLFHDVGAGFPLTASGNGILEVDGLSPGEWDVRVFQGTGRLSGRPLIQESVELKQGEDRELVILLPSGIEAEEPEVKVTVSGTLQVHPTALGADSVYLQWKPLVPKEGRDQVTVSLPIYGMDDALEYSWMTDELLPGSWEVEIRPFGYREQFEIGAAGASGIVLTIPVLAQVNVQLRDATNGKIVSDPVVRWYRIEGEDSHYSGQAQPTDRSDTVQVLARPGPIQVQVSAEGYSSNELDVDAHLGLQTVEVEVHPTVTIVFTLREGTTVVKREIDWWLDLECEALSGEGHILSYSFDGSAELTAEVSTPGLYRFSFQPIDGYLPIVPIEREVSSGRQRIEVPVEREP